MRENTRRLMTWFSPGLRLSLDADALRPSEWKDDLSSLRFHFGDVDLKNWKRDRMLSTQIHESIVLSFVALRDVFHTFWGRVERDTLSSSSSVVTRIEHGLELARSQDVPVLGVWRLDHDRSCWSPSCDRSVLA